MTVPSSNLVPKVHLLFLLCLLLFPAWGRSPP